MLSFHAHTRTRTRLGTQLSEHPIPAPITRSFFGYFALAFCLAVGGGCFGMLFNLFRRTSIRAEGATWRMARVVGLASEAPAHTRLPTSEEELRPVAGSHWVHQVVANQAPLVRDESTGSDAQQVVPLVRDESTGSDF